MSIPFPKMHIATSVLNRIANTLEERGPLGTGAANPAPPMEVESPIPPNPHVEGSAINNELKKGSEPVAVAPEMETDANNGMLEASAMGGSPFNGALLGSGSF